MQSYLLTHYILVRCIIVRLTVTVTNILPNQRFLPRLTITCVLYRGIMLKQFTHWV